MRLTAKGRRGLGAETESWRALTGAELAAVLERGDAVDPRHEHGGGIVRIVTA